MVIIDVRSEHEFGSGHVKGAVCLPVEEIAAGKMPDVPKDGEVVLYCRSGGRSAMAINIMKANGFTRLTNGLGLENMSAAGYEVVR